MFFLRKYFMNRKLFLFIGFLVVLGGIGISLIVFAPKTPESCTLGGGGAEGAEGSFCIYGQSGTNKAGEASILSATQQNFAQTQTTQIVDHISSADSGEHGFVKRAVDGDTLVVVMDSPDDAKDGGKEEKVRLIGINTPESVDPRKPVECFGKDASKIMDGLATGHNVTLRGDSLDDNRDRYGRLLRYVYLEDGTFVNAWMVEHGDAFAYVSFPFSFKKQFVTFEKDARAQKLGLWDSAVCPYDKIK